MVRHAKTAKPIVSRKELEKRADKSGRATVKQSEFPEGMTVEQTTEWVSGDKERAQAALDYENKQSSPRSSLVHSLERILSEATGAGIASGEA